MSASEILYSLMVFVMVSSGFTAYAGVKTALYIIDYCVSKLHLESEDKVAVLGDAAERVARKFACWFACAVGSGLMFHILMTRYASSGNTLF